MAYPVWQMQSSLPAEYDFFPPHLVACPTANYRGPCNDLVLNTRADSPTLFAFFFLLLALLQVSCYLLGHQDVLVVGNASTTMCVLFNSVCDMPDACLCICLYTSVAVDGVPTISAIVTWGQTRPYMPPKFEFPGRVDKEMAVSWPHMHTHFRTHVCGISYCKCSYARVHTCVQHSGGAFAFFWPQ